MVPFSDDSQRLQDGQFHIYVLPLPKFDITVAEVLLDILLVQSQELKQFEASILAKRYDSVQFDDFK